MRTFALILIFSFCVQFVFAQISFAPSVVFVDEHSGIGNIYISNRSEHAQEIMLSFQFGYPDSDAQGNFLMNYTDTVARDLFGLDGMIRAFPRAFILEAGSQRTVRLQVRPNSRLNDGVYFTRVKVFSKSLQNSQSEGGENIAQLGIQYEQITGVFYKKGNVTTGLHVKGYETAQTKDVLETRLQLSRYGNAPFIGSVSQKLYTPEGQIIASSQTTTTTYFEVVRKLQLPIMGIDAGSYELEVAFETKRRDMSSSDLVQAKPLVFRIPVELKDIIEVEFEETGSYTRHQE